MEQISLLTPRNLLHWLRIYRLYQTAFPAAERKPFSVILRCRRRGQTDLWCIHGSSGFLGFAATVNSPELILLDYFAVETRFRGQGIGTAALKLLLEQYAGKGIFVEIESTREPGPDQLCRQQRKAFYLRCGMQPLGVTARVFGVAMELLGWNCQLTFPEYRGFYRDNYSPWAEKHITEEPCPDAEQTG